jgi:hypothetical protein
LTDGLSPLHILSSLLSFADRLRAYDIFKNLVGTGKIWDHKNPVLELSGNQYWSVDNITGKSYKYEAWSNMHYGYIGRLAGFSEYELLNGAGLAQDKKGFDDLANISTTSLPFAIFDDPLDQNAVREGFKLYEKYKNGISTEQFVTYLRNNSNLDTSYGSPAYKYIG